MELFDLLEALRRSDLVRVGRAFRLAASGTADDLRERILEALDPVARVARVADSRGSGSAPSEEGARRLLVDQLFQRVSEAPTKRQFETLPEAFDLIL